MIFSERSIEAIMSGRKTQTRRLVKPGEKYLDLMHGFDFIDTANERIKWRVMSDYAIQPGRGKKQIARFRVLRLRKEDVRKISWLDARNEGFVGRRQFWKAWCLMHDKQVKTERSIQFDYILNSNGKIVSEWLMGRPDERYQAWVIVFELMRGANDDATS